MAVYVADLETIEMSSWYPKQPFINGCFNWMIPNLYIENGCFTKHPLKNGCLGYQDYINVVLQAVRASRFHPAGTARPRRRS